jgi:broad specificity phosphatase PhoE
MKTTLYLIRHGETEWNVSGRWQGHTDIPLNDVGKRQAELVANRLRAEEVRFDAIYSSDLSRAFQTAWAIGAAVGVAVQLFPPLREIDLGVWSGLTREEIQARYPIELSLLEQGQDIARGGGETNAALTKRVSESVRALAEQHPGETLCLVGHGGSLRALMRQSTKGAALDALNAHHLNNASISVMVYENNTWELLSYNDTAHLGETVLEQVASSDSTEDAEGFA